MPKAILELEMPESCWECQVLYKELRDGEDVWFVCAYLNKSCPQEGKRPDCPLKLVDDKSCKYCNSNMSYGNNAIYKEDGTELFIANNYLKLLKEDTPMARSIIIRYCPMCGRKLKLEVKS